MARFRADDAEKYGNGGSSGKFFSLKNDKDVATVRFMYNGIDDVEGMSVHEVTDDQDKKHYVNCIREYNDPKDVCPFCASGMASQVKLFIPVYDVDEDCTKTWERGKTFVAKISSLCSRYPNLVSHTFEIERNGVKGDTNTTYEIYETGNDDTTLEDLPEKQDLSNYVWEKTPEDMDFYLENGYFPPEDDEEPPKRRGGRNNTSTNSGSRRTPASSRNSRRGDAF